MWDGMTDHDHLCIADTDPAELAEQREADANPCTTYIRLYLPTGIELPMADGPITPDEEEMFAEWFEDRLHSLFPRLDLRVYWTGVEETKIYIDGTDGIQRGDILALLSVLYPMWERGVL